MPDDDLNFLIAGFYVRSGSDLFHPIVTFAPQRRDVPMRI
jgi:hypothetical protein